MLQWMSNYARVDIEESGLKNQTTLSFNPWSLCIKIRKGINIRQKTPCDKTDRRQTRNRMRQGKKRSKVDPNCLLTSATKKKQLEIISGRSLQVPRKVMTSTSHGPSVVKRKMAERHLVRFNKRVKVESRFQK